MQCEELVLLLGRLKALFEGGKRERLRKSCENIKVKGEATVVNELLLFSFVIDLYASNPPQCYA